jgi:hypothetical protein
VPPSERAKSLTPKPAPHAVRQQASQPGCLRSKPPSQTPVLRTGAESESGEIQAPSRDQSSPSQAPDLSTQLPHSQRARNPASERAPICRLPPVREKLSTGASESQPSPGASEQDAFKYAVTQRARGAQSKLPCMQQSSERASEPPSQAQERGSSIITSIVLYRSTMVTRMVRPCPFLFSYEQWPLCVYLPRKLSEICAEERACISSVCLIGIFFAGTPCNDSLVIL